MRLIDADAALAALAIFHRHDNDNDSARHFMNGIETAIEIIENAPDVKAVPLTPLAKWLAGYVPSPGGIKAHKVIGASDEDYARLRAEAWEDFLREMDWGEGDEID